METPAAFCVLRLLCHGTRLYVFAQVHILVAHAAGVIAPHRTRIPPRDTDSVTPSQAGVQERIENRLDSRPRSGRGQALRGNDKEHGRMAFLAIHQEFR